MTTKTCPTCGNSVAALIHDIDRKRWVCHLCIEDQECGAAVMSRKIDEHMRAGTLDKYPIGERLRDLRGGKPEEQVQ